MAPRTRKQFEEIRQEKRRLIMDTAQDLFAKNTFELTSISQIADKAQISKGLMYNYFKSKNELLEAILNRGVDELIEIFDPNKDGMLEPHEVAFFIVEFFRHIKQKSKFWKIYLSVSFQPSAINLFRKRLFEMYEPFTRMMTEYFRMLGFKNPEAETLIFSSVLDGVAFGYIMAPENYPLQIISQEMINKYCNIKNY